ncbi:MAG: ABC transporter permease [Eubacteriales bacterium]|jgi:teichoic acid transport system permease protein
MKKSGVIARIILAVVAAAIIVGVMNYRPKSVQKEFTLCVTLSSDRALSCRAYYLKEGEEDSKFSQTQSASASYSGDGEEDTVEITLPYTASVIRFDPATEACDVHISSVELKHEGETITTFSLDDDLTDEQDAVITEDEDGYNISLTGDDGYLVFTPVDTDEMEAAIDRIDAEIAAQPLSATDILLRVLVSVGVGLVFLLLIVRLDSIIAIPKEIFGNMRLVMALGKNDFKNKFAGSFFGTFWAFVQPIITVFVYWFVFEKALNAGTQATKGGIAVPYVLWLLSGLVPWFFFQDAVSTGASALIEYTYLVKKVVFKVSCLPVVKIVSSLYVHFFFIGFTILMFTLYGMFPGAYTLQLFYYSFALLINVTGIVYMASAITAFFRDMRQIVNIGLQVGVWFTPIMWNIDSMNVSGALLIILKANPLYYIVMGYRDSLINQVWFWQRPGITLYFWMVTILLFVLGTHVFKRLQPHFADVL